MSPPHAGLRTPASTHRPPPAVLPTPSSKGVYWRRFWNRSRTSSMTPTSTAPLPDSRSRPWIPATWHSWLFFSDLRASSTTAVTVTCPWGWTSTTWPRCSSAREMTTLLLLRPMMVVILSLSCSKALVRTVDFACFWCFFVLFFLVILFGCWEIVGVCLVNEGGVLNVVFMGLGFCCHCVWLLWKCGNLLSSWWVKVGFWNFQEKKKKTKKKFLN